MGMICVVSLLYNAYKYHSIWSTGRLIKILIIKVKVQVKIEKLYILFRNEEGGGGEGE